MSTDRLGQLRRTVAHPLVVSGLLIVVAAVLVLGDSSLHSAARVVATTALVVGLLCWVFAAAKTLRDRAAR